MQERVKDNAERLVRKQILISPEQSRLLKAKAQAAGLTEAAIIRTALDRELGIVAADEDWKRNLMAFAGSLADEVDLAETVRSNRAHWSARIDAISRTLGDDG